MSEAFEKENTPAAVLSSQQVATPPSLQKSNSRSPLVGETSKIQCSSPLYKKQKTSEGYSKPEQRDKSDSLPLAVSELLGVAKFLKSRGFQTDSIGTVPNDGRFEDLKEMLLEKVAELKSLPICRNISPIDWNEIERCYSHLLALYVKETQEINEELEICFNVRIFVILLTYIITVLCAGILTS